MKHQLTFLMICVFAFMAHAQNVNIPDENFKSALLQHGVSIIADYGGVEVIDTNGDNEISEAEAIAYTGTINVNDKNIADLTGIEAFVNCTKLFCADNQLTSLDVRANTALLYLYCQNNQLTSLDVSESIALTRLYCSHNQLTSLDVSTNTQLVHLDCYYNQLTSLDVSTNTQLVHLDCYNNQLISLDINGSIALIHLNCDYNQLTSLDASTNAALKTLSCRNNQLTSLNVNGAGMLAYLGCRNNYLTNLDLSSNTMLFILSCLNNEINYLDVSNNTLLNTLACYNNQLSELDLSLNTMLTTLFCGGNQLVDLDLSSNAMLYNVRCQDNQLMYLNLVNGNNANMFEVDATGNQDNLCIQHDANFDPTTDEDWMKDETAFWTTFRCPRLGTEELMESEGRVILYPNPAKEFVNVEWEQNGIDRVELIDMSGRIVLTKKVKGKFAKINITHLATGMYVVKIGDLTKKLLIQD